MDAEKSINYIDNSDTGPFVITVGPKLIKIEIPGKPIPLSRARASKSGFYDSQYKVKQNIRSYIRNQIPDGFKPRQEPIKIFVTFTMPMPKSWSKKKKRELLGTPHLDRPDASNLLKFYEDCFNKVLWCDDSILWSISIIKIWGEEGSTIIEF
jgi:Holliday junction resolvase RusA-like endonuclease